MGEAGSGNPKVFSTSGAGLTRAALVGFAALLPLQRWGSFEVGALRVYPCDVFLALAWASSLPRLPRLFARDLRPLTVAGMGFLAALLLSLVVSGPTFHGIAKWVAFGPLVLLPPLFVSAFEGTEWRSELVPVVMGAVAAVVVVGLFTVITFYVAPRWTEETMMCGYAAFPRGPYPRLCAPFGKQNALAGFLVAMAPVALAWVLARRGLAASLVLTAAASVVMLFTLSAGVGAFGVAVAWLLFDPVRERLGRIAAGALAVLAAAALMLSVVASVFSFSHDGAGRHARFWDGSRPSILEAGARTFAAHPIFGVGYGERVAHVTDPRSFVPFDRVDSVHGPVSADLEAHNLALSLLGQAGVVGFAAFATYLAVMLHDLLRVPRDARGVRPTLERGILAAVVATVGLHGLFAANEEQRYFWLLLALASVAGRRPAVAVS